MTLWLKVIFSLKRKRESKYFRCEGEIVIVQKEVLPFLSIVFVTSKLWFRLHFEMVLFLQTCFTNLIYLKNNVLKSSKMLDLNQYDLACMNLMIVDQIPRQCGSNCATGTNLNVAHQCLLR